MAANEIGWTVNMALRTSTAWLLLIGFILSNMAGGAFMVHQVAAINDKGFSIELASGVMTVLFFFSFVIKPIAGVLTERIPVRHVAVFFMALAGTSLLVLAAADTVDGAEEIVAKVQETADLGGRQILMQSGHHPRLKTDWWCDLIADLKERFPQVNSHALSAPELEHLSRLDKRPVEDVIRDLKEAGLGSVPGAGAACRRLGVLSGRCGVKNGSWMRLQGRGLYCTL